MNIGEGTRTFGCLRSKSLWGPALGHQPHFITHLFHWQRASQQLLPCIGSRGVERTTPGRSCLPEGWARTGESPQWTKWMQSKKDVQRQICLRSVRRKCGGLGRRKMKNGLREPPPPPVKMIWKNRWTMSILLLEDSIFGVFICCTTWCYVHPLKLKIYIKWRMRLLFASNFLALLRRHWEKQS